MELIGKTNIDFLSKRYLAITLSVFLVAASVYIWFAKGDSKFGIDFKGGNEVVVRIDAETESETLRKMLEAAGFSDSVVQGFELEKGKFAFRLGGDYDPKSLKEKLNSVLKEKFPDKAEILKADFVGPTIGNELRRKALIAVTLGLIGILIYVTVRFEFAFALGAVIAVLHDVIIATGAYILAGHPVNMATLAAALTVVGYSVNDTIVIFDRVREEIYKQKEDDLYKIFNNSLNSTLSRTIITSLLTFFSVIALLIFGGGALADMSVFFAVGIVVGSYSTIFIASPVALAWENFRHARSNAAQAQAAKVGK